MIKHKSGVLNKVADAQSETLLLTSMKMKVLDFEFVKYALCTDPFFSPLLNNEVIENQSDYRLHDGFLFEGTQLCVPEGSLRLRIIQELITKGLSVGTRRSNWWLISSIGQVCGKKLSDL